VWNGVLAEAITVNGVRVWEGLMMEVGDGSSRGSRKDGGSHSGRPVGTYSSSVSRPHLESPIFTDLCSHGSPVHCNHYPNTFHQVSRSGIGESDPVRDTPKACRALHN
jgi:hypothetical protein